MNDADFAANSAYHLALEELSRTIWAPGEKSQWFYERARGQFQVALGRLTGADKTTFEAAHPVSQMFTKTDVAAFMNAWGEAPHLVSRGAQKNFQEFTLKQAEEAGGVTPDDGYFKRLVARGILFRHVQAAARRMKLGAYRANVVAYTMAYLTRNAAKRLELDEIWRSQSAPSFVEPALPEVFDAIQKAIVRSAAGRNVTEWCKREDCWKEISKQVIAIPEAPLVRASLSSKTELGRTSDQAKGLNILELARVIRNREFVDDRQASGNIYLIGGKELAPVVLQVKELGFRVMPSQGNKTTRNRDAWMIKLRP